MSAPGSSARMCQCAHCRAASRCVSPYSRSAGCQMRVCLHHFNSLSHTYIASCAQSNIVLFLGAGPPPVLFLPFSGCRPSPFRL